MTEALRMTTIVLAGGKLELVCPQLETGQSVEVLISPSSSARSGASTPNAAYTSGIGRSAVDILNQAPGHLLFQSAEEVDEYIKEERSSWDR